MFSSAGFVFQCSVSSAGFPVGVWHSWTVPTVPPAAAACLLLPSDPGKLGCCCEATAALGTPVPKHQKSLRPFIPIPKLAPGSSKAGSELPPSCSGAGVVAGVGALLTMTRAPGMDQRHPSRAQTQLPGCCWVTAGTGVPEHDGPAKNSPVMWWGQPGHILEALGSCWSTGAVAPRPRRGCGGGKGLRAPGNPSLPLSCRSRRERL